MNRYSVEQYALTVCALCVIGLVFSVAEAAYSVVRIYAPNFTMPRTDVEYRATVTNDAYWKWLNSIDKQQPRPTDEELAKRRIEAHGELLTENSQLAKGTLLQSLIYIVMLAIFWFGHWRLALRYREHAPPTA
jgi:hypothetical protein